MTEISSPDDRFESLRRWLESTLDGGFESPVRASEDASFRRYFRVRAGDRSFIVMDAPPTHEECGPFLRVLDLLRAAGVNAPRAHAADRSLGFILLDDLGDTCYLDRLDAGSAENLYADAFGALTRMQRRIPVHGLPRYDHGLIRRELDLFPEWFLRRHLAMAPGERTGRVLADVFAALESVFDEQPAVFVHRDYHSRNLMVTATDNPGVIDFQDAVVGPVTYDLASLLRDVYIRWPDSQVERWVDAYHDRAVDAGVLDRPDRAAFRRWFDLTGVQRHVKIAGIFARLFHRDGKPRYLADLPLTVDYIMEVAARHPETRALAGLLGDLEIAERLAARAGDRR